MTLLLQIDVGALLSVTLVRVGRFLILGDGGQGRMFIYIQVNDQWVKVEGLLQEERHFD
jgi:hypothetical protein